MSGPLSTGKQSSNAPFDISNGSESVPVLCNDPEAAKTFTYAAVCPESDMRAVYALGSPEICGCSCANGCSEAHDCPCKLLLPGTTINMRECGSACSCSVNRCCQNSPVFNGLTCRLAIEHSGAKGLGKRFHFTFDTFRARHTSHAGVFALENIENGKFVCEYAGQRINIEDALSRTTSKGGECTGAGCFQSRHNYILIFKEHFADGRSICTCLDPTHVGNVGRFINHSCGPNLDTYAIRVGDNPHPRVAFFAARDIHVGEELTFSYHESSFLQDEKHDRKPCFCGHVDCQKWYDRHHEF
jgi:histone-lysine N-methyltransferase SETMAR